MKDIQLPKKNHDSTKDGRVEDKEYNSTFSELMNCVKSFFELDESKTAQLAQSMDAFSKQILYLDIGYENNIILQRSSVKKELEEFLDGMTFLFKPKEENSSSSSLIVGSLEKKTLKNNGKNLTEGFLRPNVFYIATYIKSQDYFEVCLFSPQMFFTYHHGNHDDPLLSFKNSLQISNTQPSINLLNETTNEEVTLTMKDKRFHIITKDVEGERNGSESEETTAPTTKTDESIITQQNYNDLMKIVPVAYINFDTNRRNWSPKIVSQNGFETISRSNRDGRSGLEYSDDLNTKSTLYYDCVFKDDLNINDKNSYLISCTNGVNTNTKIIKKSNNGFSLSVRRNGTTSHPEVKQALLFHYIDRLTIYIDSFKKILQERGTFPSDSSYTPSFSIPQTGRNPFTDQENIDAYKYVAGVIDCPSFTGAGKHKGITFDYVEWLKQNEFLKQSVNAYDYSVGELYSTGGRTINLQPTNDPEPDKALDTRILKSFFNYRNRYSLNLIEKQNPIYGKDLFGSSWLMKERLKFLSSTRSFFKFKDQLHGILYDPPIYSRQNNRALLESETGIHKVLFPNNTNESRPYVTTFQGEGCIYGNIIVYKINNTEV